MNFDETAILSVQAETGFELLYIEKVLRLMGILELFYADELLRDKYALKGGTALNLFYFKLPRLSVDIDLNYISLDRIRMQEDRIRHEERLRQLLEGKGYLLKRVPTEHAGGKWRLGYHSFTGLQQNIELDVNYMHRVLLLPLTEKRSYPLGTQWVERVKVLDLHELAAGKFCAFIARCKPRDLFDTCQLLHYPGLNRELLRFCFVVYAAFNKVDFSTVTGFGPIKIDRQQFRQELVETLAAGVVTQTAEEYMAALIAGCQEKEGLILPFTDAEQEFLVRVNRHGELKPELIAKSEEQCRAIATHPMLQWKVFNVRKHYGLPT